MWALKSATNGIRQLSVRVAALVGVATLSFGSGFVLDSGLIRWLLLCSIFIGSMLFRDMFRKLPELLRHTIPIALTTALWLAFTTGERWGKFHDLMLAPLFGSFALVVLVALSTGISSAESESAISAGTK